MPYLNTPQAGHDPALPAAGLIRQTLAAGINTAISCHSFWAAGITKYLRKGGELEIAQQMANDESVRTRGL